MIILDERRWPEGPPVVPPLLLRQVRDPARRAAAVAVLHGAQPPHEDDFALLVLVDPAAGRDELPAAALLVAPEPDRIELWNLGIRAGLPTAEIADRLLTAIADWLRAAGGLVLSVRRPHAAVRMSRRRSPRPASPRGATGAPSSASERARSRPSAIQATH